MQEAGRLLSFLGTIFLLLSLIFNIVPNLPKIPGDIYLNRPGIKIYIPWVSSLVLSVILTIFLDFFRK